MTPHEQFKQEYLVKAKIEFNKMFNFIEAHTGESEVEHFTSFFLLTLDAHAQMLEGKWPEKIEILGQEKGNWGHTFNQGQITGHNSCLDELERNTKGEGV